MACIHKTLSEFIGHHGLQNARCVVAVSGGVDSIVLLAAFASIQSLFPMLRLRALHVHHGLQADADLWAAHCQQVCTELSVPVTLVRVAVLKKPGESLEAEARAARYEAFAEHLHVGEFLFLAHHQDDQAETVLLQLLRGAGLTGLVGMPAIRPFANGYFARPFLARRRADIEDYAKQHAIRFCHDHSNDDRRFRRNQLRHEILPALSSIQPKAVSNIARSATHLQEAQYLLDELAATLLYQVQLPAGTLSRARLLCFSACEQKLIIRYWLRRHDLQLPSQAILARMLQDMLHSAYHAKPCVAWGRVALKRAGDFLFLVLRDKKSPEKSGLNITPSKFTCV